MGPPLLPAGRRATHSPATGLTVSLSYMSESHRRTAPDLGIFT